MHKLILLLMILPGILFAGTQVFAPFFIVGGTLKADSLAARALTLTSSANIASLTINSDYTFPTSDGSADQILKTDGSGTLSWGSFTGAGAGGWTDGGTDVYLTTTSDKVGIGKSSPAAVLDVEGGVRSTRAYTSSREFWPIESLTANRFDYVNYLPATLPLSTSAGVTVTDAQYYNYGTTTWTDYACDDSVAHLFDASFSSSNSGFRQNYSVRNMRIVLTNTSSITALVAVLDASSSGTGANDSTHIIFERSNDAVTWTVRDSSSCAGEGTFFLPLVTTVGGNTYMRITIRSDISAGEYKLFRALWLTGRQMMRSNVCPYIGLYHVDASTLAYNSNYSLLLADDKAVGLGKVGGSAAYVEFDDQATDEVNFRNCNVGVGTGTPSAKLNVEGGNVIFNDASGDYDVRVETDGNANTFVIDGGLNAVGIGAAPTVNTYDLAVNDSTNIKGNLLLGAYGGAYSYVHPGQTGFTASSTRDVKVIGPEKKVNVLPLIKSLPVYEWRFDADKIKDKFKEPAGFDTLSIAMRDSIRTDFLSKAALKAAGIAKEKHVSPLAEDWYTISQYFGGNPKEISGEHVMWTLMLAVKQLNARCDSLESRIKALEVTRTMPIEVKDE